VLTVTNTLLREKTCNTALLGANAMHPMFGLAGHVNENTCDRKANDDGDVGGRRGSPRYIRFMDSKLQNLIKLLVSFLVSYLY
jgi:hypothetical protein